jgi:hypothetical protein
MSDQFWLTKAQLKRIEPFFLRTRGIPRVDDRRVVSGINSKLHAVCDGAGRPVIFLLTEGQMSRHVAKISVCFQGFPIFAGGSTRHGRDITKQELSAKPPPSGACVPSCRPRVSA